MATNTPRRVCRTTDECFAAGRADAAAARAAGAPPLSQTKIDRLVALLTSSQQARAQERNAS